MLIRLTPDQVSEKWDALGQAILKSFVDNEEAAPSSIQLLQWLMEGRLHCWIHTTEEKVDGVVTTCFVPDIPFDTFSLLVFSLWAKRNHGADGDWDQGFARIKEFAAQHKAGSVLFFTKNPSVAKFARRLGSEEKLVFKVKV